MMGVVIRPLLGFLNARPTIRPTPPITQATWPPCFGISIARRGVWSTSGPPMAEILADIAGRGGHWRA